MQSMGTATGGDSPRPDVEEGFFLEYVMQAAVPATAETPALMGPHVVEIVAKGAQLTYPLATMRSFCHDIVETYSHYVYPPWVAPYPQVCIRTTHSQSVLREAQRAGIS